MWGHPTLTHTHTHTHTHTQLKALHTHTLLIAPHTNRSPPLVTIGGKHCNHTALWCGHKDIHSQCHGMHAGWSVYNIVCRAVSPLMRWLARKACKWHTFNNIMNCAVKKPVSQLVCVCVWVLSIEARGSKETANRSWLIFFTSHETSHALKIPSNIGSSYVIYTCA